MNYHIISSAVVGLLATSSALLGACGTSSGVGGHAGGGEGGSASSTQFCYLNKTPGSYPFCECFPTGQDRSVAEWDVATTCGDAADLVCFADVRTSGDADSCTCYQPTCIQDASGYCECTDGQVINGALDASTAEEVASCDRTPDQHCCAWSDGSYCWCIAEYCGSNIDEIDSCDPGQLVPPTSNQTSVKSCG